MDCFCFNSLAFPIKKIRKSMFIYQLRLSFRFEQIGKKRGDKKSSAFSGQGWFLRKPKPIKDNDTGWERAKAQLTLLFCRRDVLEASQCLHQKYGLPQGGPIGI